MEYCEAEDYLLHIPMFQKKSTMEETRRFMDHLGSPGENKKIIHIAGTNGKGSVCAYLRSILIEEGESVGMFTSPHLVNIRERIQIGSELIGEEDFAKVFCRVKDSLEVYCKEMDADYHPAFFEFLFFMAMVFFEEKGTDYIILETGLGGRLDATNIVKNKEICIITAIGYDHMEYLGDTLEQITSEKADIIRENVPVVYWNGNEETSKIIKEYGKRRNSILYPVSGDDIFHNEKLFNEIEHKSIDFSYHSRYYGYVKFFLPTGAYYQMENVALAIRTLEVLRERNISYSIIQAAIKKTVWPGRMEEIESGIFLDGAHNTHGMKAFLSSAAQDGCKAERYLIIGIIRDKQYLEMINMIVKSKLFHTIISVPVQSERGIAPEELYQEFVTASLEVKQACELGVSQDAIKAYQEIKNKKRRNDFLYVAGSLYLVGQIKLSDC